MENREPDTKPGIQGRGRQRSSRQERGWFQISGKEKIKKPVNESQVIHEGNIQILKSEMKKFVSFSNGEADAT